MKKRLLYTTNGIFILAVLALFSSTVSYAQTAIPFEIKNTSDYADGDLYVAIVGISNGRHVWVDMTNGQLKDMSPSYNTVAGPVYNGNKGPGTNGMYANCFTKLSNIPNKKINLQGIEGCRAFISVKSQLYFYFFGATGAQQGYTSPSHTDPTDPNTGIKYEIIELTYNNIGFWGNTTRVDSYQYPMALELTSNDGSVVKTGELKSHTDIIAAFKGSVPAEFQSCYDSKSDAIIFPTKTVAWADGSIGTMPNRGPYVDYMQSYIDQVWAKYRNEDLIFSAGDAGVFRGRVSGNQLTMTCISGGFNGRTGIVQNKPTTQEAFEGKGVFDRGIADVTVDLVVQAQLTAAFTRHLISLAANPGQQNWSVPSTYYGAAPCNYYAKFWHRTDISLNGMSYGFAYDDVFNQSSTLHSPSPKSVLVLFGGYAKSVPPTDPQVPSTTGLITVYRDCNYSGFSAGLSIGDYNLAKLKALGVKDDDISSLRITEGYQAILYQDDNFGGTSTVINSDNTCLNTIWNDKVTSLRITANGVQNVAGTYYLQNRNSSLNMDVWGLSTADGANIAQGTPNGGTNQQFKFTHLGNGLYQVLAVHSGKSIDIDAIKTDDGANVQQWTYFGSGNQQFIVVGTDLPGCYKLIASHSGKVVEVGGFSMANGGNIQQWTNVNQLSGHWKFIALSTPPLNGTGTGLTGNYFNGMNFETPVYNRTDATINFNWGNGSPNAAVNADAFSARWTGQIQPRYSGVYTFFMNTDNGRRLWINGQLVIDKWIDDWNIDYSGTISLTANQKYDIKIEYFENYGGAGAKLEWSSTSQAREVVPASQLYPNGLPEVSITSPANNASFNAPAAFTIAASATDNGGSIAKVEFYNGATKLGEDNTAPYEFSWTNAAAGTYTLTTRAFDNRSAVSVSGAVTVKVNTVTNPPANKAPTVSLTSPANGTSWNAPASIAITANASDADGSVAKVEFYNGAAKIGEDATSPYAYTISNAGAGTYVISVKAIDNLGAVTASGSVSVTVVAVSSDQCASVAAYVENGGYVAGSKVKNAGRRYECKEFPYSGWCNGASWAYGPGTGAYWSDAWYDRGACSARTSGSDVIASEASVLISPNPSSGLITIHADALSTVTLYNAQGVEVMKSLVAPQGTMDIGNLSSGMYTVRIDTGAEVLTRMVVKN